MGNTDLWVGDRIFPGALPYFFWGGQFAVQPANHVKTGNVVDSDYDPELGGADGFTGGGYSVLRQLPGLRGQTILSRAEQYKEKTYFCSH